MIDEHGPAGVPHADVRVDLAAIRDNVAELGVRAGAADVMAVVKADGYGHGLVPAARAARAGGASWLGTAVLAEALALRAAGIDGRIMAWLCAPGERWAQAIEADIDVSASAPWALEEICAAARQVGRFARVHVKVDTGLGRAGAARADWQALVDAALKAESEGLIHVVGVWSHFAVADEPANETNAAQVEAFREAVALAEASGLRPDVRHLANSAATLVLPGAHFDMVRTGLAVYGLSPVPEQVAPADVGLRPAMSVRARLALVKEVPEGHGVSYGHLYVTDSDTSLGLVPLGYADGVPRHASGGDAGVGAPVLINGVQRRVAGSVCMDQFMLDLRGDDVRAGDEVVLFGGGPGEPSAQQWAEACGTISYEIVTRFGPRLVRTYVGVGAVEQP